jgi:hypothetical protein
MTIICHAELFGVSTLIADLLLTSEMVPQQQIAIPIARNVNQFIQSRCRDASKDQYFEPPSGSCLVRLVQNRQTTLFRCFGRLRA